VSDAVLELAGRDEAQALFGPRDRNLRLVRDRFGVEIVSRDLKVTVRGDEPDRSEALAFLTDLLHRSRTEGGLAPETVAQLIEEVRPAPSEGAARPLEAGEPSVVEGVRLRTDGQRAYVKAMLERELVFSVGPAGTGKTFLAVLMAVRALKAGDVQRIVLCRPAVEAGEKLGYLPGDYQAKVNPYMRPLYDALYALIDFDTVKRYIEREVIEVVPLAYMRGRTLNDAFIILDEAQNTTRSQMKMFLTRMGEGSRIVVTGDVTQVDLPRGVTSGLIHAESILASVDGIAFVRLTAKDVVRHALVARILDAYEGRRRGRGGRK